MTDIEIAEENKDNNENIDTKEVEEPKKRRRRRTKAQIEADKAAESQEEKPEQDVENGVDASAVAEESESDSCAETGQETIAEPETSIVEDQNDLSEANADDYMDADDCAHEHVCECSDECEEESCSCVEDGSKVFGTLRVYDKPSDSSTWKILTCVYEKVGEFGPFFKVQRVRQGFGIVNCYVKKSDFTKIFNR